MAGYQYLVHIMTFLLSLTGAKMAVEIFLWPKVHEVIKLFSCSAHLRLKFKLLINTEIAQINEIEGLELQRL